MIKDATVTKQENLCSCDIVRQLSEISILWLRTKYLDTNTKEFEQLVIKIFHECIKCGIYEKF